jgi:hypothetical protein
MPRDAGRRALTEGLRGLRAQPEKLPRGGNPSYISYDILIDRKA